MFIFSQVLVEKKIKHLWERSREWCIWEKEHMLPLYITWLLLGTDELKLEIEINFSTASFLYSPKRERKRKPFQNSCLPLKISWEKISLGKKIKVLVVCCAVFIYHCVSPHSQTVTALQLSASLHNSFLPIQIIHVFINIWNAVRH